MGDRKAVEGNRDAQDAYELGPVESVNDLAPERNVGPTRQATTQQRLFNADAAGYFESEAGGLGGLGAPLHIGRELKKDGGRIIDHYEDGYNTYAQPLRSTLRAMGRVKDVSLTGAPMTPEELKQRPDLLARFERLSGDGANWAQEMAYNNWTDHQTKLQLQIERLGASQHELAACIANYRRVQAKLKQRKLQAQRAADSAKIAKIEETAAMLAQIVEVCAIAASSIGSMGTAVGAELATEGLAELGGVEAAAETVTTQQRVANAATRAAAGAKKGHAAVTDVAAKLKKAGALNLTLKDVFIVVIGDSKEYSKLQEKIERVDENLQTLAFVEEAHDVFAAKEKMKAMSIELAVRRGELRAERTLARRAARTFGRSLGENGEAVPAMYAAEAFQELAQFGAQAARERQTLVDPRWGAVYNYINGNDVGRYAALGAHSDAVALATNLKAVREQRDYFNKHLPDWELRAKQWNDFLADRTGAPLLVSTNTADGGSGAP